MNDEIEKLLSDFPKESRKTYANAADERRHTTCGEAIERLLKQGQALSLESLRSELERQRDDAKEDGLIRAFAVAALSHIDGLTPPP